MIGVFTGLNYNYNDHHLGAGQSHHHHHLQIYNFYNFMQKMISEIVVPPQKYLTKIILQALVWFELINSFFWSGLTVERNHLSLMYIMLDKQKS